MTFEDFCGQNRIGVVQERLPAGIRGFTRSCGDGCVIVINIGDDDRVKRQTLDHEMSHIIQGHLYHTGSAAAECCVREDPMELRFE